MRTTVRAAIAIGFAVVAALFIVPAAPALANAPAAQCDSGAGRYICDGSSTGTTTWSVVYWYVNGQRDASPTIYTTSGSTLVTTCPQFTSTVHVSYSYVSGGVTIVSDGSGFQCNFGPSQ